MPLQRPSAARWRCGSRGRRRWSASAPGSASGLTAIGSRRTGWRSPAERTAAPHFRAPRAHGPPGGFGFLIPRKERRRLIACTWVGTKFPYRVPEGKVVARCFLGGTDDAAVLTEPDEAIVASVLSELREIAGVRAQPRFTRISRWPRSMAQYIVGHPRRLAEIEARTAAIPGLFLAGNAYTGIGIPDCIRMGRAAAEKIMKGAGQTGGSVPRRRGAGVDEREGGVPEAPPKPPAPSSRRKRAGHSRARL